MATPDFGGAESGFVSLASNDGEGHEVLGTIAAGASKGLGAYHYHLSSTDATSSHLRFKGSPNGAQPTGNFYSYMVDLKLHQNGTQKDFSLFKQGSWQLKYTGNSDSPAKLRFLVSGVEVDAANAPVAILDAWFTVLVYIQTVSPFACKVYIDDWSGGGFALKQSANAASNPSSNTPLPTIGTDPGKGNTSNLDIDVDNFCWQTDDTTTGQPLVLKDYVDVIAEVVTSDGTNKQWNDHTGAACTGVTCYTEMNQLPPNVASYTALTNLAAVATKDQEAGTGNAAGLTSSTDTIYGVKAGGRATVSGANATFIYKLGNAPIAQTPTRTGAFTSDGVATYCLDNDPNASAAWTVSGATGAKVGVRLFVSPTGTGSSQAFDVYKFIAFHRGAAAGRRRTGQAV